MVIIVVADVGAGLYIGRLEHRVTVLGSRPAAVPELSREPQGEPRTTDRGRLTGAINPPAKTELHVINCNNTLRTGAPASR